MANRKIIHMTVEKTDTGFSAYSDGDSIHTTGKTIPELINNAFETAKLCFKGTDLKLTINDIKFEMDVQQFSKHNQKR